MGRKKEIDMTTGPIMKKVFLFAIPIIIGNVLQQLYTTVDTLVIGRFCGDEALAGVGTSAQPVEVLLCIFLGIGTGTSILVSQYKGAKDDEGIKKLCGSAVTFVYACAIPVSILGIILAPYMLRVMKVPADAYESALYYTRLVFVGTLGNIGYNMNAGILRGLGDSLASLRFLLISCISNIVLDVLFVAGFGMGVSGAALATSLSMYLSWIMSIVYIRQRFTYIGFSFIPRGFYGKQLKEIVGLGLPIGLNNSLYSFGHVAIQVMVNSQGTDFVSGITIAGRITGLSNIAITALSSAATTYAGQNYGAGNYKRLKDGHLRIPLYSGFITLSFGLFFISIRQPILAFFSSNPAVLGYASRYVFVLLLSQWIYAIFNGIMCILNGIGKVRYTTIVNILMLWMVRIPSGFIITRFFDGTYVMLCYPISFTFAAICMLSYYIFSKQWKDMMKLATDDKASY